MNKEEEAWAPTAEASRAGTETQACARTPAAACWAAPVRAGAASYPGTRSLELPRSNARERPCGRKGKVSEEENQRAEAKWRPGEAKIGVEQVGGSGMILQHLEKKVGKEAKKEV